MKKFFMSVLVGTWVEIKFYGAFAPPAPHPTHWLISTQVGTGRSE